MNLFDKARILGDAGKYDSCGPKMCEVKVSSGLSGIYYAKAEHKTCKMLKTVMTNECRMDCKYCPNRNNSSKNKASFEPMELATLFDYAVKKLDVNGLFLSSGVNKDPDRATEQMIEAVRLIRNKFKGYIHFKILPGTSYELVKQASELATRMSINIEAPNKEIMSRLSSSKDFKVDILRRQSWLARLNVNQTTQVIVNDFATDKDILKMTNWEYKEMKLKRVYYSAFRPVKDTPFENEKQGSFAREHRLYNVDFLLNKYNYNVKDFNLIMNNGMLPRDDPKLALAKATFEKPIDVNEATYSELIKIPGIGPKTAKNIINKSEKITKYEQLHNMGAFIERAKPFIAVEGKRQKMLSEF